MISTPNSAISVPAPLVSADSVAVLRLNKIAGGNKVRAAIAHNCRAPRTGGRVPDNIDSRRTSQNVVVEGGSDHVALEAQRQARMRAHGIHPEGRRRDSVLLIEAVVSLAPDHRVDAASFFHVAANWLAEEFGGASNLLCAHVHNDEGAPHMHVLIMPIVDGRLNGSDMVGGPKKFRGRLRRFGDEVAGKFELAVKHEAFRRWNGREVMLTRRLESIETALLCLDPSERALAAPSLMKTLQRMQGALQTHLP